MLLGVLRQLSGEVWRGVQVDALLPGEPAGLYECGTHVLCSLQHDNDLAIDDGVLDDVQSCSDVDCAWLRCRGMRGGGQQWARAHVGVVSDE